MTSTPSVVEEQPASLRAAASDPAVFTRLLDAAIQLRPQVAKYARETERNRCVSMEGTNRLKEAVHREAGVMD